MKKFNVLSILISNKLQRLSLYNHCKLMLLEKKKACTVPEKTKSDFET